MKDFLLSLLLFVCLEHGNLLQKTRPTKGISRVILILIYIFESFSFICYGRSCLPRPPALAGRSLSQGPHERLCGPR